MRNATIIHHGGCFDGVTAAWVTAKALHRQGYGVINCHPAQYGSLPPDVRGQDVFIVDFSYPRPILLDLQKDANSLLVLDHHETAKDALEGLPFCIFDMERSGAGIAWDHFFPREARPWLVDSVEDRDLWRFKKPGTKEILAVFAAKGITYDTVQFLMDRSLGAVVQDGVAILQYIDSFGEAVCKMWVLRRIGGYDVPTINTPYMNGSDHIDKLSQLVPGYPFYASFFAVPYGWQFSLRSKGDFKVNELAKKFGGGGHPQAAGFNVTQLPWEA